MPSKPRIEVTHRENFSEGTCLQYEYGGTPVEVMYFDDDSGERIVVETPAFVEPRELAGYDREEIEAELVTEFFRQETGLYFSPEEYNVLPGEMTKREVLEEGRSELTADEQVFLEVADFATVFVDPADGVTLRDVDGEVVAEVVAAQTDTE